MNRRFEHLLFPQGVGLETARISLGSELKPYTRWGLTEVSGRGGGAGLTLAFSLLREAQQRNESVLWLSSALKPFYPPDAQRAGIDLRRLPVLFLRRPEEAFTAAVRLLGSGGFSLVVWDLVSWKRSLQQLPLAFLGRLNAMARHHRASVLVLTDKQKSDPSLGCLVGLRLQVEAHPGCPELLEVEVVRDKRGIVGEGKRWDWRCGLPDGLPASAPLPVAASAPTKARMAG
ncbi:MAG: recombinase A [Vulcanimicrobiota bacterium]